MNTTKVQKIFSNKDYYEQLQQDLRNSPSYEQFEALRAQRERQAAVDAWQQYEYENANNEADQFTSWVGEQAEQQLSNHIQNY